MLAATSGVAGLRHSPGNVLDYLHLHYQGPHTDPALDAHPTMRSPYFDSQVKSAALCSLYGESKQGCARLGRHAAVQGLWLEDTAPAMQQVQRTKHMCPSTSS